MAKETGGVSAALRIKKEESAEVLCNAITSEIIRLSKSNEVVEEFLLKYAPRVANA